jgi:hypothetical protein
MVLGLTGAWFTDTKDGGDGKTLTFGKVALSVTSSDFGTVSHSVAKDETYLSGVQIMPGDKISYKLTVVKGADSEDFYYLVMVTVTGVGDNQKLAEVTSSDVKCTLAEGWTGIEDGTITLTGADYDNEYESKDITLNYEVRAIQAANIADEAAAFALLTAADWAD